MVRTVLVVVIASACGRVGFDARATADAGALTLRYPRAHVAAVLDVTALALVPTVSDPTARFAVAPALPAGVALDPATGAITGVPTAVADDVAYAITATTAGASATAALELTVLPGYVVDTTADDPDVDGGGDVACATAAGRCSLRAAIQTTNHRATKQLVLCDTATYALGAALDPIANDVVIAGTGATLIHAAAVHAGYPALTLATSATLALRDLELADFGGTDGGALAVTAGTLDVDRCAFTNNASPGSGGVLFINGGAQATFAHAMFTGNASLGGSGGGWGGVIDGEDSGTAIVVRQSAATQNTTAWGAFSHITTGTTLRLENSTLFANTSTTAGTLATPGGIYTLVNATIVNNLNTSTDSAGIYLFSAPCAYTVTNSLVAFNRDSTGADHDCNRRDLSTVITSGGGNLLSDDGANCATYFTAPGDRLATDPLLDPAGAGDRGGATPTQLVLPGSPAIDGAQDAACPPTDQRDAPRPLGAHCDVGAVEVR